MSNADYKNLIENLSPKELEMELQILHRIRLTTDGYAKEIRKKINMILAQQEKLKSNKQ